MASRRTHGIAVRLPIVAALVVVAAGCSSGGPEGTTAAASRPDCAGGVGTDVTTRHGGRDVLVHLPACYSRSKRRYPVVYLLHGAGADEQQWVDIGTTVESDRLARAGQIGDALLVMPDQGDTTSAEQVDAVPDLIRWVDLTYRTIPDRDHRAIGGISRGGQAALTAATRYSDTFGSVGGHSTTLPPDREELLVGLRPLSGHIRLDVGASDPLEADVVHFAADLQRSGSANLLEVGPGDHDRNYWRASVDRSLEFYAHRWI